MAKITILRALNEVSTLNKRIEKNLHRGGAFLSFMIGDKAPVGFKDEKEVADDIKSRYQTSVDLIERRTSLKAAIVASNAITMVTINGQPMTVAAAIEFKTSVAYKKDLLSILTNSSASINRKVDQHNDKIEIQADAMAGQILGNKTGKTTKEDMAAITEPFKESRIATLIDPLNIKVVIDKLEDEISGFESEVDNILTESNATVEIEVPEK
jgi:hypothetical protein